MKNKNSGKSSVEVKMSYSKNEEESVREISGMIWDRIEEISKVGGVIVGVLGVHEEDGNVKDTFVRAEIPCSTDKHEVTYKGTIFDEEIYEMICSVDDRFEFAVYEEYDAL